MARLSTLPSATFTLPDSRIVPCVPTIFVLSVENTPFVTIELPEKVSNEKPLLKSEKSSIRRLKSDCIETKDKSRPPAPVSTLAMVPLRKSIA